MKIFRPGKGGFSFIETILSVVIVSTCFISLVSILSDSTVANMKVDFLATSVLLARGKMAEVVAKDFDSVASGGLQNFGGNFGYYNYNVTVNYADPAEPNTAVAGPTDYKKIDVAVSATGRPDTVHIYGLKVKIE